MDELVPFVFAAWRHLHQFRRTKTHQGTRGVEPVKLISIPRLVIGDILDYWNAVKPPMAVEFFLDAVGVVEALYFEYGINDGPDRRGTKSES